MENRKIACTVGILTFNSASTLRTCLESVSVFKEVLICDGGSTDATLDIASEFGCQIFTQSTRFKNKNNSIKSFSGVRNQLLHAAEHQWFVFVDSDEFLSTEVVEEIEEIILSERTSSVKVFKMPRRFVVKDVVIKCASTYPNFQIRFFNKDAVFNFIKDVHERIDIKPNEKVGTLQNHLMVPVDLDIADTIKKQRYYLSIEYTRHLNASYLGIYKAFVFNLRALLVRVYKNIKIFFFCRGQTKMPILYELLGMWYSIKLLGVILLLLVKKMYRDTFSLIKIIS